MPTTENTTATFDTLRYAPSLYSYESDGVFHKIRKVERKRVNALVTWVDGSTETVRLDEERRFQREVPTEEELEADRVAARLEYIKRFVAQGKASYTAACARVAHKSTTGAHTMTSFDLDTLLESSAKGTVAARVEHAALLPEGLTDSQRVERVAKMCSDVIHSFWGSQSTSNAANQLEWHMMATWADLSRDVRRGW